MASTLFAIVRDPCYHEDLAALSKDDAQIRGSRPKALTVAYVGCLLCCISGRLKTILTCFPEGRSDGRRRINSNEAALLCAFVYTSWPADIFCASCAEHARLIMCDPIISESSIFPVAAHWETDVIRDADIYNFFLLGMSNTPEKDLGQKKILHFFYGWFVFKTS